MIAASQIGQSAKLCGAPVKSRTSRKSGRRSCVAQCSTRVNEESLLVKSGKIAINAAVAAALMGASGPASASKIAQLYRESQAEESLFAKIIRERGDKLPEISIPKGTSAPRLESKEEGEVYVPPKQVELVDIPLKLSEPVRTTTVAPSSRVPEPEPAKKSSVSQEGVVKIIGDLPSPPPAKRSEAPKEAPKLPFSFAAPKAEEAPKVSAPTLPLPPPAPAAKVDEAPKAEPTPVAEPPKPFGGFFSAPGTETKPAPAESTGEAGKPELPQQEPAVTPGTKISVPESKNIAPEAKVESPKPATKAPSPEAPAANDDPFAIFSQSAATPAPQKAPAPKPEKPKPSEEAAAAGTGLPVWVGVGGSIAVAVAAFVANGKNQGEVRAAEEQLKEGAQSAAQSTADLAKDLEPTTAKGSKEE